MKIKLILTAGLLWCTLSSFGQDTTWYKLRLNLPVLDIPQNYELPYYYPSMDQSLELANDFYELSFWGIDELGDVLFISKNKPYTKWKKIGNTAFKYAASLVWSQYGSELPIPLGVWAHEEFHMAVLGVVGISSINGNSIFTRWDGTVYGVSDSTLSALKQDDPDQLLYSYVAGVQSEILFNQKSTLDDFYWRRTLNKNAFLLYNAYYTWNYFRFSASDDSDSAKANVPQYEDPDPTQRDYAGDDLNSWVYDMFLPDLPYTSRDTFPDGEGVNRRIGYSDLPANGQEFLKKQKNLSLLNFVNPGIFFFNRIKLKQDLSFNFFLQYAPTYFGNSIAFFLPVQYKKYAMLFALHNYNNEGLNTFGVEMGMFNYKLSQKLSADLDLSCWNQPISYFKNDKKFGGAATLTVNYSFPKVFKAYCSLIFKSDGWLIGNPYLDDNLSFQLGVTYGLAK
jgi:hypothetical protein